MNAQAAAQFTRGRCIRMVTMTETGIAVRATLRGLGVFVLVAGVSWFIRLLIHLFQSHVLHDRGLSHDSSPLSRGLGDFGWYIASIGTGLALVFAVSAGLSRAKVLRRRMRASAAGHSLTSARPR